MGTLYYIVNLTKHEFIGSCDKFVELHWDKVTMGILCDLLRDEWEGDQIAILSEDQLHDLKVKPKEIEITQEDRDEWN